MGFFLLVQSQSWLWESTNQRWLLSGNLLGMFLNWSLLKLVTTVSLLTHAVFIVFFFKKTVWTFAAIVSVTAILTVKFGTFFDIS